MEFREWLNENASTPAGKQSLYPLSYGGIGLYPPPDIITWSADAITYMPLKDRKLEFSWGNGMKSKPQGLEIHNKTEQEQQESGKPIFKWGKGILSKPSELIDTIKTLHTQPRDSENGVRFIWGKGILSRPSGVTT